MADKRWQGEYAARLARSVSRREEKRGASTDPTPQPLESQRAAGGFAAYARGKSRQGQADRRALADLMGVIRIAKTTE
jgi:hypothetical protein